MVSIFQRVDTLFIPVTDIQKSIDWYSTVFGCELVWIENEEYAALNVSNVLPKGQSANIELGHCMITLVRSEAFSPLSFKRQGEEHPYFNFYTKAIEEAHSSLKEQGTPVTDIVDEGQLKYFNFYDLNGHYMGVCCF
ncbi:VOC family protein [Paenibacillus kobensis]|uniref:VOC family protein n=1 Tax=Paenibacillus kobensis TaxID=59841 RepID=UPI000FD93718|nr:VOC family protein [Paenibacillus kobensis]